LNKLSRLVVVDSVNFTPGAAEGASTGSGGPTGSVFAGQGAPPLMTIPITARLFTPQGALGAAPGAPGSAGGARRRPGGGARGGVVGRDLRDGVDRLNRARHAVDSVDPNSRDPPQES